MEELGRALAALVARPPSSPFEAETIVVSSKGMERWLAMQLADALGVWQNPAFPFPRAFIASVIDRIVPETAEAAQAYERQNLTWAVLSLLGRGTQRGELDRIPELERYLAEGAGNEKALELAERIADAFDQYATYRPDLVLDWEQGGGRGWQPALWRALTAELGPVHVAARVRELLARWPALSELPSGLPSRVSMFGVSALPPLFVDVLAALATKIDVHLFLMRSSREHGLSPERARRAPLYELGRLERDFARVIEKRAQASAASDARMIEPGRASALRALQSAVLDASPKPVFVDAEDRSIEVHACHGPMREVEVLRDRLLGLFHDDPSLRPKDVVVMTPDIATYAPLVQAVFGQSPDAAGFIPYRVADLPRPLASPVADALVRLLAMIGGRFGASELLDLLKLEPIRRATGIDEAELPRLESWVARAGVRWAIDAEHRREAEQPPFHENTWRFGLERLLLGFALPGGESALYRGVLPLDAAEGRAALAIGALAELVERLAAWRARLAEARPLDAWQRDLFALLDELTEVGERDAWELRVVRETIEAVVGAGRAVKFTAPVEPGVIGRVLERRLASERTTHDFLSGAVTFCALLPMRSIPFRVVGLIGMNDGDFPRIHRPPAFDEIGKTPRLGDRSVRDEDRYSFLEALLAARERLLVTYVGRGVQDDLVRPPSVVLAELLDAANVVLADPSPPGPPATQLELPFRVAPAVAGETPAQRIVLEHPLQAWSPRYFGLDADARLFSHSLAELAGARAAILPKREPLPFVTDALPARNAHDVDIDELARFFENPARHLVERCLGIQLRDQVTNVLDREPFELTNLEVYELGDFLLERARAGIDQDRALVLARAAGLLPLGELGRSAVEARTLEVATLAGAFTRVEGGPRLDPIVVDVPLDGVRLTGALAAVWPSAQVRGGFARGKAKLEVALWVRHLVLQLAAPGDHPRRSVLLSRARTGTGVEKKSFGPVEPSRARALLSELVQLKELGERVPLPVFPAAALAYAEAIARHGDDERARRDAAYAYRARTDRAWGDLNDAYVKRLHGHDDPLADDYAPVASVATPSFVQLATRVFGPLVAHAETEVLA